MTSLDHSGRNCLKLEAIPVGSKVGAIKGSRQKIRIVHNVNKFVPSFVEDFSDFQKHNLKPLPSFLPCCLENVFSFTVQGKS